MLAPPPSNEVKSDHRFPATALIEQHLTNASPRRTSYSLYHHNTHEPEVYSEFNWESHSSIKLSHPVNPTPHFVEDMDKKPPHSPDTSVFDAHRGGVPASPSSSLSDTVNSDSVNASNDICATTLATLRDTHNQEKDAVQASNKRPRPPSLTQWDHRDRSPYSPTTSSRNANFRGTGVIITKEDPDSIPPIVTRGESTENETGSHAQDAIQVSTHFHYNSDSAVGNENASANLSANRPHDNSISLQSSSDSTSFTVEDYSHSTHSALPTPLSASSISFSSHQPDSQPLFSSHSNGYLSALPSPVVTQCNEQTQQVNRQSYPASPLMTLSAPNSATFPPVHNSAFSPLSPQPTSASNQSQVVSPSPPPFQNAASNFCHNPAPHLSAMSYRQGGAEDIAPPATSSVHASGACVKVSSNTSTASPWSAMESQAPRRRGKLPSAVTGILKTWLMSHTAHPYPTEEEKKSLCEQTQLTMNQVSNWFINARRRILVPPSAGNAVHEVRQPVRKQAQSQLARSISNSRLAPPCLTIRHLSPHSLPATPSPGLTMFSPVSSASPNLSNASSFDFRYPITQQASHESHFHSGNLNGCRPVGSLSSSPGPWHHSTSLLRQPPSSPLYPHGSHPVPYYSSSHSTYPTYHANNHSASSTPLPSPHYSYAGCAGPYSTAQPRLNSPRSHPSTPTVPHSANNHHPTSAAYITQAPCNQSMSHPATPDRED